MMFLIFPNSRLLLLITYCSSQLTNYYNWSAFKLIDLLTIKCYTSLLHYLLLLLLLNLFQFIQLIPNPLEWDFLQLSKRCGPTDSTNRLLIPNKTIAQWTTTLTALTALTTLISLISPRLSHMPHLHVSTALTSRHSPPTPRCVHLYRLMALLMKLVLLPSQTPARFARLPPHHVCGNF